MLRDEPEDTFLNYVLALEYVKAGDLKKGIGIIEDLLKKDPEYLGAYYQLGQLYEQVGETDKAVFAYKKGIELAKKVKNNKTLSELNQALFLLEE